MFEWKNLCLKKNCPPFPVNFWEKVDSTGKFLSDAVRTTKKTKWGNVERC